MITVVRALAWREWIRFMRQPHRLIGSLGQPLLIWLFLGSGFGASFRPSGMPGTSYLEYFYPGVLLMMMLFAGIFSTITIIEDRNAGLLQGVLVAPVSRWSIVLGKVGGGMAVALTQSLLLLGAAPFIGLSVEPGVLILLLIAFFLCTLGFTALGFLIAWNMESTAGFHAIMSVFLMPLWMLSGALFPLSNLPDWLWWMVTLNPVTYALRLIRMPFYEEPLRLLSQPEYLQALAVSLVWALICLSMAVIQVNRRSG